MTFFLERTDLRYGGRLPIPCGAVSIGRSPGNTIVLTADDHGVSAYHAVIYADPQRILLQDLSSTNGSYVNGRKVQECLLGPGDEIGLGRSGPKFRVVADGGADGGGSGVNNSINGINGITDINNGTNGINNGINNINTYSIDPGASLDAALTGIINPTPRVNDGVDRRRPHKRRTAIIAAIAALAVVAALFILLLIVLIPALSPKTTSTSATKASPAGKDFFSAPPASTPISTPASTSVLGVAASSSVALKINAVLTRFGEDGYNAPPEMIGRVEHYIAHYKGPMRGTIALWIERSRRYLDMIRAVFSEKNIPLELAYVSMLESGFNTQAVSRAGAGGMWQFMPHTARRYGLRVDGGVDERTDPEKSTRAAAAYFKDLIAIFGSRSSVLLCMAAYNAGEQRVINALKRIDDPMRNRDFWYLYRMGWLAQETNEYIPQIIALIIISDSPEEYGFSADGN